MRGETLRVIFLMAVMAGCAWSGESPSAVFDLTDEVMEAAKPVVAQLQKALAKKDKVLLVAKADELSTLLKNNTQQRTYYLGWSHGPDGLGLKWGHEALGDANLPFTPWTLGFNSGPQIAYVGFGLLERVLVALPGSDFPPYHTGTGAPHEGFKRMWTVKEDRIDPEKDLTGVACELYHQMKPQIDGVLDKMGDGGVLVLPNGLACPEIGPMDYAVVRRETIGGSTVYYPEKVLASDGSAYGGRVPLEKVLPRSQKLKEQGVGVDAIAQILEKAAREDPVLPRGKQDF
jgi:hypothetical protein